MTTRASTDHPRPRATSNDPNRPQTAPHTGTPSSAHHHNRQTTPLETTPEHHHHQNPNPRTNKTSSSSQPAESTHQPILLADPVALRYLSSDPSTSILTPRATLTGYESYIIEQWTTSRSHPTFVITTYTGNPSHSIVVGVLSVPRDESTWSPRLKIYFRALNQYHARRRETDLGVLMVTSLPSFPSSLTVIPVPGGDLRAHRTTFFVAENLKRLGCSGRVGLTLTPPSAATGAKFLQLYRTSDKNDLDRSVIELVKLCQSALMLFGKLEIDYADGLLCDVTERAITDWWVDIGSETYNIEPHDGILGPTTVAGLLGLLMGSRNRLHAVGAAVGKDPFDVEGMKRGISSFQKGQRMERTRRLDRRTLERLVRCTAKAAEHGGHGVWSMPKVLKNTAAELSGKGGEMLVDAVGRRDRAGIAEIETCELERFVELVYGERAKWLWRGKAMKKKHKDQNPEQGLYSGIKEKEGSAELAEVQRQRMSSVAGGLVFKPDEQGGFTWAAGRKSGGGGEPMSAVEEREQYENVGTPDEEVSEEEKRGGVIGAAKSGLGKFRGAVGLKGHGQNKLSVDDGGRQYSPTTPVEDGVNAKRRPMFRRAHSSPLSSPTSPRSPRMETIGERQQARVSNELERSRTAEQSSFLPANSIFAPSRDSLDVPPSYRNKEVEGDSTASSQASQTVTADPSIAGSIYNGIELDEVLPTGPETEKDVNNLLRRTMSYSHVVHTQCQAQRSSYAYPRHLSFSLAEESVLTWTSITTAEQNIYGIDDDEDEEPYTQLATQTLLAKTSTLLRLHLNDIDTSIAPWTQTQISSLTTSLLEPADRDIRQLHDDFYTPHSEQYNAAHGRSDGVLRQVREELEEGGKEIETLAAKLEYEIGELRGRVGDVGQGVLDYGKAVEGVEGRVKDMEKLEEREGEAWLVGRCVVC
ncbi:hypothetical protein LTR10_010913 [Elasticomyces elasticus]|nr:hypothetical protein LTR10_010913 [Elasticomyces elasticus]KAK4968518.1 hypothetical protein LTR42_009801 [Elasticomyces elasticus]